MGAIIHKEIADGFRTFRNYISRFKADGGSMYRDGEIARKFLKFINDNNIPKPLFFWLGEAASKFRVSGIYTFFTKIYSLFVPTARYGAELVVNGDMSSAIGWSQAGVVANGVLTLTATGSNILAYNTFTTPVHSGGRYKLTYTIVSNSLTGTGQLNLGGFSGSSILPAGTSLNTVVGTYILLFTSTAINAKNILDLYLTPSYTSGNIVIDNVSVVEVLNSLDGSPTDATQATSTSQPYLSGNIAPNEKLCLKNVNGDSRFMTHPTISFGANEAWTVQTVLNWNGFTQTSANTICSGGAQSSIRLDTAGVPKILIKNESNVYIQSLGLANKFIGKNNIFTFIAYGNGTISIYINSVFFETVSILSNLTFSQLFGISGNAIPYQGTISSHAIYPAALTPAQVATTSNFLRNLYPEIPTVKIGNDYWATSNCEMVATPQGNLMANVTANANVEKVVNGGFDTDTNWNKDAGWSISGGFATRINTGVTGQIYQPIVPIIGKYYKVTIVVNSITSGSIQAAFGGLAVFSTQITVAGTYAAYVKANTADYIYIIGNASFAGSIDNISIQEIGWSGSTELYDGIYAQTTGTVEQKTYAAVKAAAMWCFYNNDMALGSVYGKLYNWYAVKLLQMDIDYYNAANPTTPWGYRVPTDTDFNNMATALGGASVAGGKMKVANLNYWFTLLADNSSGFSSIGTGCRNIDGTFTGSRGLFEMFSISNTQVWGNLQESTTFGAITNGAILGGSIRLLKS